MLPVNEPQPFADAGKSQARLLPDFGGIEPEAVIPDGQLEAGLACSQAYGGATAQAGLAMLVRLS